MNPHEYEVLRRFADAMTACHNPAVGCDCCPNGSKTDCYFDDEDRTREALDILNRLLDAHRMPASFDFFSGLTLDAKYALKSHSRDLVYQTYGAAMMAYNLGAINRDQFYLLNDALVVNGLNNPSCRLE